MPVTLRIFVRITSRVMLTLTAMLEGSARSHSSQAAIVKGERSLTYPELVDRSTQVAVDLSRRGFRPGDRLVNWLPNSEEWLVFMFAAARLGLISPLFNTRYRAAELERVLRTTQPRGLALHPGFHGIDFERILAETGCQLEHVLTAGDPAVSRPAPPPKPVAAPQDLAILFTTSGTTAWPKLAGHDHRGVVLHAANDARAIDLRPDDVMLVALPLCGAFGFAGAMAALSAGASLVLQAVFEPSETLELLERHRVTHFYGSDSMLRAVLEAPAGDRRPFESWRWGCHANFSGQPLELVRQAQEAAGVRIHGTYGSSECFALMSRWAADAPVEERAQAGGYLVGKEMRVRTCDPETGRELAPGEHGELQFHGYNVTTGYFGNEPATRAAFTQDGWYRSGDLGYVEPTGAFVFLSRLKDSMRVRGYLVDPLEIEEQLERHAAVEAAQVVGVPVAGEGDVPVAYVKLRSGAAVSPEELALFCGERLASYKAPRLVRLIDEFPFVDGPNGRKIQKGRLRERGAADLAAAG
jgi:acyl-CoA synthetase (AMP-forming)/AMP-acid ligase II